MIARPNGRKANPAGKSIGGGQGTSPVKIKKRPNNQAQRREENDVSTERGHVVNSSRY